MYDEWFQSPLIGASVMTQDRQHVKLAVHGKVSIPSDRGFCNDVDVRGL